MREYLSAEELAQLRPASEGATFSFITPAIATPAKASPRWRWRSSNAADVSNG